MRPSTPSPFQDWSSTAFPAASTIRRWNVKSCWTSPCRSPRFAAALSGLLDDLVLDLERWPVLRELAWNRAGRWILAEEALGLYERNWRFVDLHRLGVPEAALVERLKARHGGGVLNA